MNDLQAQLYDKAPSPCPTCSDPSLRQAHREEQRATLDHFKVGDRVRTTRKHRLNNYESGPYYERHGTVLELIDCRPLVGRVRVKWDPVGDAPDYTAQAWCGNVEHVKP